jgi:hypothetical protein
MARNQGGEGEASDKVKEADALFSKRRKNVKANLTARAKSIGAVKPDIDFYAGEKLTRKIRRHAR